MNNFSRWLSAAILAAAFVGQGETLLPIVADRLLPLVNDFAVRHGLTNDVSLLPDQIKRFRLQQFENRRGATANMVLTNSHSYSFYSEDDEWQVVGFKDGSVPSQSNMRDAMLADANVMRALSQRNQLSREHALSLALRHFAQAGHNETNFHPVVFFQAGQGGRTPLPIFAAEWFRRDVWMEDKESGVATLPCVRIEISGVSSNLSAYSRAFLPIGADFQREPRSSAAGKMFHARILPEIRQFVRRSGIQLPAEFGIAEINDCKVLQFTNPPGIWAWVEVGSRFGFEFKTAGSEERITLFKDLRHERGAYLKPAREGEMLDRNGAESLAQRLFNCWGLEQNDFDPIQVRESKHIDHLSRFRGEGGGTLVFGAVWKSKNVSVPIDVEIEISATASNLVYYSLQPGSLLAIPSPDGPK